MLYKVQCPGGHEWKFLEAYGLPEIVKERKNHRDGCTALGPLSTLSWRFALAIRVYKVDFRERKYLNIVLVI